MVVSVERLKPHPSNTEFLTIKAVDRGVFKVIQFRQAVTRVFCYARRYRLFYSGDNIKDLERMWCGLRELCER